VSEYSPGPRNLTRVYFNYFANNTIHNCLNGIIANSQAWNGWAPADPYPGISCLGNTCADNTIDSVSGSGFGEWAVCAPIGDQFDFNIFDDNTVANTPIGIDLKPDSHITNVIAYKNNLSLGTAPLSGSIGISLGKGELPALRQNKYAGFARVYGGPQKPAQIIEAPSHVVSIQGAAHGPVVTTSFVLWDAGTASLYWKAASDSKWLAAANPRGSISNENGVSTIKLTCNPAALARGVYSGTVTVKAAGQVRSYTVIFRVRGG
jgi:hypothetical protein